MKGLDRFKAHFAGFEDHYVLIGGAACDVLMSEAGLAFRATRDLDLVLCVEAVDVGFGRRFWDFVEAGGYENRQKGEGDKQFYRFDKPTDDSFPFQLELFSRRPDTVVLEGEPHLTPVPIGEDVASLSAILLDRGYYEALIAGARLVDGVRILDESLLIPFKARAYLDMVARRDNGGVVDARAIAKHRGDVFRLLQVFGPERRVTLPDPLQADMIRFLAAVTDDPAFDPAALGVGIRVRAEAFERLRRVFQL
jgi:hypothetical protein